MPGDREKTDILQGMLDMLILKTLAQEPLHGYGVAQRIKLLSGERLSIPQGSLYPGLHRLEHRRLIKGKWTETSGGRRAKYYELTAKGRKRLEEEIAGWRDLSQAISLIMETR
jgi:PadR family transcriptional regulator